MLNILVWKRRGYGDRIKRRLYIPSDSTITFKLSNPLVTDVGLFSYPFTVPYAENKEVFDFPAEGKFQVWQAPTDRYSFELYVGSEKFLVGDVEIVNAAAIEIYLKSGSSSVASLLRNTYMDSHLRYNFEWGKFTNYDEYTTQLAAVTKGKYPEFNFAAPVIKTPETVDQHVCFYLRFLLKKIISNLEYVLSEDQSLIVEDMNRVFLFANKKWKKSTTSIQYAEFLPHIHISDFLSDVQERFNLVIFFSPFSQKAFILHLDKVFSLTPVDWTGKFISDEDYEKYSLRDISFENDADDKDVMTDDEIQDSISEDDLYTENVTSFNELKHIDNYTEMAVNLSTNGRYYNATLNSPSRSFSADYYLKISEAIEEGYPANYSKTATNQGTGSGTLNLVQKFTFTKLSGTVSEVMFLKMWGKKDQDGDYRLIAILYSSNEDDAEMLSFCECSFDDLNEKECLFKLYLNREVELEDTSMVIKIFEYHPTGVTAGTVTIEYGGWRNGAYTRRDAIVYIDKSYFEFREYGCLANYGLKTYLEPLEADNDSNVYENKPDGLILLNTIERYNDLTFRMAESDISKGSKSEDFAWSVYRGLIDNELFRHESISANYPDRIPFAFYDDKDELYNDYQSRLTCGDIPSLSLRWDGDNGLINKCFKNTVSWKRHFSRSVIKKLDLTISDILSTELYKPVIIGSQKYFISGLSIPIRANGEIEEVTAELLTI